jgi:hypothetical protein
MTVYVDPLAEWGWRPHGVPVPSCHMFTDTIDLADLHAMAERIGMRREWFQDKVSAPHYDLTPPRRASAVAAGAVEVPWDVAVKIWQARRAALAEGAGPG